MGCSYSSFIMNSFPSQVTYKICLKCNLENNKFNKNIMILNSYHEKDRNRTILFICSEGHQFCYTTNDENYNSIIEYNNSNIDINSFTLHKTKSIIPLALLEELDEDEL